jgi:hypothetical protein
MRIRVALPLCFAASHGVLAGQTPIVAKFEDVFEWVRSVELEHTEQALVVDPRVQADPLGGWLVFDPAEGQVRLHDRDGRLKAYFGRRGEGPGEFTNVAGVLRTASGDVVTVDMSGRFARWSADGSKMLHEFRVPLNRISGVEVVGHDSVLVLTPPLFARGSSSGPVLHVIDLARRELVRSFYEPMIPENARTAWSSFIGGNIAVSDGVIGVTVPLLDSLLLLSNVAGAIARIPLGVLGDNADIPDGRADLEAFMEWTEQVKVVGLVRATPDGWLVPVLPVGPKRDAVDLLVFPRAGGRQVLVRDAPAAVGTDRAGEFVFDDPERLEPQYLRTARIRPRNP